MAQLADGRVLLAGGNGPATSRDDADVWDPAAQRAQPLGSAMSVARSGHTATLQADGRIVILGGATDGTLSEEIFDPTTEKFATVGRPPVSPRTVSVAWVSPANGARDVVPDAGIVLRLSHEIDVRSVSTDTIRLVGPDGPVTLALVAAERGRLVFGRPSEPLRPSSTYQLKIEGLAAADGRTTAPAIFSFSTVDKHPNEQASEDEGIWTPNDADGWRVNAGRSPWQSLPPLAAPPGVTAIAGQVLKLDGTPLADVTLAVEGRETRSDKTGRFLLPLPGVAAGHHVLAIEGASASRPGRKYGFFEFGKTITAGETNPLPFTIWMPRLDTAHTVRIPSPTTSETVVTTPFIPGLELHLPAGTVIKDDDGNVVNEVGITPIPVDRPPFPLAKNVDVPVYFTIQPGSAYVYNVNRAGPKGAQLVYPNYHHVTDGVVAAFWDYDPDNLGWYVYGSGVVRGTQVFPSPQTRLYEFTGAMNDTSNGPPGSNPPVGGRKGGDPVDLATGLFVLQNTDLYLPDVIPLELQRTYRPGDNRSRSFGVGSEQIYDLRLWSAHNYTEVDLILPDESLIHYVRTSPGTGFADAVYQHTATPTKFFGSTIRWNGTGWDLTLKDGTVYVFGDSAPLQAIHDRFGNTVTITHSNGQTGNVTRITSPNGRAIAFTYDGSNRITQAADNVGRTVAYTYDVNGNLSTVTDPENNVTTYAWDTSHRLTSITDGRNIMWLTNQYDTSNRVTQQTLADPSATYGFVYTADANGNITQVDVTDPRGHVERVAFNTAHFVVSDTQAYGTSLQRTTTFTRQAGANFVTAVIDPLNRETDYTYDTSGHVLTKTRLAGTSDAVTTTYTYEPTFLQLASVTDALNHTWSVEYDTNGRLASVTDPLSHQTSFSLNSAGQITEVTDPLEHAWQFGYDAGDLISSTDPLGNVRSQFVDAAGRSISSTDPMGRLSRTAYDKLNRVTSVTDPVGGVTNFTYDENGNILSVSDALTHTTTYTYDDSDRVATRTDPLSHGTTYAYDLNNHVSQVTDRKSQVSNYSYDALDRLAQVTFNDSSTITYTYDAGDRITQIADSTNGTITRQFDGLNRLTEETTPEGTVDYGYDADGRRTSMTVAGQTAITYGYDDAHRMTSITHGTATASFIYDAANRRSTLTYPNGIVATYTYDAANRATDVCFTLGATTVGELTYAYDGAGNKTTVGGSWARTGLPPALTTATYDAANRIVTWDGVSSTYDLNGNLTSDGTNGYTWNARNQLTAVSGGTAASFAYDAVGRRRAKTLSGTTTNFLYDNRSPVQELSGGSATVNLLAGTGIDEILTRADSNGTRSLLADALGSTVALTDSGGTVQTTYTYEPFGQATMAGTATSNSFTFTGRERDGTGLMYYRARYYDPRRQRFSSADPIGFAGGVNHYAYVRNAPTLFVDPLGLKRKSGAGGRGSGGPGGGGSGAAGGGDGSGSGDGDPNNGDNSSDDRSQCSPGTAQTGFNIGGTGGVVSGSLYGGVVVDTNGGIGLYAGYGFGFGAGAGLSASAQVGVSNGRGISSIAGPFIDVGAGGGVGAVAGADYFGGWTDGELVQGATVSVGAGLRGSASGQYTNTYVAPLFSGCR